MKDQNQLAVRIENLERQNRRMRACLLSGLLLVGCVAIAGAKARNGGASNEGNTQESKIIEANQIILRDDAGNKRIVLGTVTNPVSSAVRTGVFVYDERGRSACGIHSANGTSQFIVEQDDKIRMMLGGGDEQFAGLILLKKAGSSKRGQINLFYSNDGKPVFGMNDSNHKTRMMMILDQGERPHFFLQDENQSSFYHQGQK